MAEDDLLRVPADDIPSVMEGAGVLVRRVIGPGGALGRLGPFLLFDHTDIPPEVGFPLHPHRGFEVLTYILRGALTHKDSAGYQATVAAGGAQHMVTGRGIRHEEFPGEQGTDCLQVWVDLPQEEKGVDPAYRSVAPKEIPEVDEGSLRRRLVAGPDGAVRFRHPVGIQDVRLGGDGEVSLEGGARRAFLYGLEGEGTVARGDRQVELGRGDLVVLQGPGPLRLAAAGDGLRFALFRD